MRWYAPVLCVSLLLIPLVSAQEAGQQEEGLRMGNFVLRPEVSGLLGYDNRASFDRDTETAEGDIYAECAAGATLNNLEAALAVSLDAVYGYRWYDDFDRFNDDFYSAGASVGTGESESAFLWEVSGDMTKSFGYNTYYNPETGEGPGSILTDEPNRLWTAGARASYAVPLAQGSSLVPGYSGQHYHQEFEESGSTEWQIHSANITYEYVLTENTTLLVGGIYTMQVNDDEDGYIVIAGAGARGRLSDKTSWEVLGGMAHADYEFSGSDQAGVLDLRANWQATEKVSIYAFCGNNYEPGFSGGAARMVYRAGYGGDWRITTRWSLGGQVLHDYTEELGGGADAAYEGVRHFFAGRLAYNPFRRLSIALQAQYVNDEYSIDQKLVSLAARIVY